MSKDKSVYVVKSSGEQEEFQRGKLESSLARSGTPKNVVDAIASHIENEVHLGIMTTSDIYNHAFELLKMHTQGAASRYSMRRAIADFGPSGFPFEKFLAEMFRKKGYVAETNHIVKGSCIEHEIDVLAYNKEKLIMVEAKFHNDFRLKTDSKDALYVKARFDDLHAATFDYGGHTKLTEGWLMTNTKFTSSAIEYGECQKMVMVGWNYPAIENLQDMIEQTKLHPITVMTTLSGAQKNILIEHDVVLVGSLFSNDQILKDIGLSSDVIKEVLTEAQNIMYINGTK